MRGLLADENVQGHLRYLRQLLQSLGLWDVLAELNIEFATFRDVGLPRGIDDRPLWQYCQTQGWVLLTDNRNCDGLNSLEMTLADSWHAGDLPVLTLADKRKFEEGGDYSGRVARDVAELLFGIHADEYRDQPRIYVPRSR